MVLKIRTRRYPGSWLGQARHGQARWATAGSLGPYQLHRAAATFKLGPHLAEAAAAAAVFESLSKVAREGAQAQEDMVN